jgi:hypothetical protein
VPFRPRDDCFTEDLDRVEFEAAQERDGARITSDRVGRGDDSEVGQYTMYRLFQDGEGQAALPGDQLSGTHTVRTHLVQASPLENGPEGDANRPLRFASPDGGPPKDWIRHPIHSIPTGAGSGSRDVGAGQGGGLAPYKYIDSAVRWT